jgi:RNA polymerase sigma-54 factor
LQKLQQLEPTGVFARNLSECLRLQLAEKNLLNNAMQSLLDNLELLAKGQFKALAQLCGVTEQQLHPMIAEIKKLDPKPGRKFASEATGFIYPDILVHKNAAGNFIIELNNELLPQFEVQRDYYHQLKSSGNACVNQYLSEHFKNANHLIYSLKQREKTLLKVTEMLIEKQSHFFNYGSSYIVPMTLKTIADAVNMHESTISRITTNKYIGTEFGIFELKYFFSSSINKTNSSQNCSSTIVKDMIKNLVNHEDAPLSDEEIVEILKVRQINIARRTVAKYREEMKIPNSTQRKQEKLLNNI